MFSHLPYTDSVIFDRFIGLRSFEVSMRRLIVMIPSCNGKIAVFFDGIFPEKFVFKLIEINSLYDLSVSKQSAHASDRAIKAKTRNDLQISRNISGNYWLHLLYWREFSLSKVLRIQCCCIFDNFIPPCVCART